MYLKECNPRASSSPRITSELMWRCSQDHYCNTQKHVYKLSSKLPFHVLISYTCNWPKKYLIHVQGSHFRIFLPHSSEIPHISHNMWLPIQFNTVKHLNPNLLQISEQWKVHLQDIVFLDCCTSNSAKQSKIRTKVLKFELGFNCFI